MLTPEVRLECERQPPKRSETPIHGCASRLRRLEHAIGLPHIIDRAITSLISIALAIPAPSSEGVSISDDKWRFIFAALVHPLPRLVRAVLTCNDLRKPGRILVMGCATALRRMRRTVTYGAAPAAQIGYVLSATLQVAEHAMQINAIAQTFVETPTSYPVKV